MRAQRFWWYAFPLILSAVLLLSGAQEGQTLTAAAHPTTAPLLL